MFFELLWMMKNSQLLTTKCRWISRTCPIAHIDRTIKANIETVRGWLAGRTPAQENRNVPYGGFLYTEKQNRGVE